MLHQLLVFSNNQRVIFLNDITPYEMQTVSFTVWTRVTVFISFDSNHYTTNTATQAYT